MRTLLLVARSRSAKLAGWFVVTTLGVVAASAYAVALWRAPDWLHTTDASDRYNARLLVISIGGGVVVVSGLLYTARNYRLSRRGQITDRFTQALERLGSGELYVRIGGVHALAHVMHDSQSHHDEIIEVLTQFIRQRVPVRRQADGEEHRMPAFIVKNLPPRPDPDIQTALTTICQRPARKERQIADLSDLHLARANLRHASLTGVRLAGASLGAADMAGANLSMADLSNADLSNANLVGADLSGANLTGADLRKADLSRANLSRGSLIRAKLMEADLSKANLSNASLRDADLTRASLYSANFRNSGFRRANLTETWLVDVDLSEARSLADADFTDAQLGGKPSAVPSGWQLDRETGRLQADPSA